MDNRRKTLIILGVLSIIFIAVGVAYAFFSYSKGGSTENSISTGYITFHYTEGNKKIKLIDALPMSDEEGKVLNNYFDFTIESNTSDTVSLPYYVTVRRSDDSDSMLDSHVKVYLTTVDNNVETPVALVTNQNVSKFSELGTYTHPTITIPSSERALYEDTVPVGSHDYNKKYRLRMWIDDSTSFNSIKKYYCGTTEITQAQYEYVDYTCENGEKNIQEEYPYNNKSYTLTVNVYSEGQVAQVTQNAGTIDSCPGCRFYFKSGQYIYYKEGYKTTLAEEDTTGNYNDVVTSSGKNFFLGVVLSEGTHGTVDRVFTCAVEDNTPYCIEGVLASFLGGDEETCTATYVTNSSVLTSIYGDTYDQSSGLGCRVRSTEVECYNNLTARTESNGAVHIGGDRGSCDISNGGFASCSTW